MTGSSVFTLYEQNIGVITPMIAEVLKDAEEEYGYELIEKAMMKAIENNVRRWSYVSAILERWKTSGYEMVKGKVKEKELTDHEKWKQAWERDKKTYGL